VRTLVIDAGIIGHRQVGRVVELREFTFAVRAMKANLARASGPRVGRTRTWYRGRMTGRAADPDRSPGLGA
jgi:hypothetical protein